VLTRFIDQVAAVSCAATHVPEIKLANHMFPKNRVSKGGPGEIFAHRGCLI
jgi:hypothetical protein